YTLNTVGVAADWTGNTFTWTQGATTCSGANTTYTGVITNIKPAPTSGTGRVFCYEWISPLVVSTTKQYEFSIISTHTVDFLNVNTAVPSGTVSVTTNSAMSATYKILYTPSLTSESVTLTDNVKLSFTLSKKQSESAT